MDLVPVIGVQVAGVTSFRRLDLDHVRTQVSQDLAAQEAPLVGKIQDPVRAQEQAGIGF